MVRRADVRSGSGWVHAAHLRVSIGAKPVLGSLSRWNRGRATEWEPLAPKLVVEVGYDHFSGGRFRHGTAFVRFRPEKNPRACRLTQVE